MVNDSLLVRGIEGISDLARDRQRFFRWKHPSLDSLGKRLALYNSITRYLGPRSCKVQIFGWFNAATTHASRSNGR
jgi:hypothetical protein